MVPKDLFLDCLLCWQKSVNRIHGNMTANCFIVCLCMLVVVTLANDGCSSQDSSLTSSNNQCSGETQHSFVTRYAKCSLSPECGEGPYFIEEDILRNDLVEDRAGYPLSLKLNIVDYRTCSPITGAKVHIWHPDFAGIYSGFMDKPPIRRDRMIPKDERRFLRGTQISDHNGTVIFETLFPGHYRGRTPHIHFRIHLNDTVAHIGQIFFSEKIIEFINSKSPYNRITSPRMRNEEDGEFNYFGGARSIIELNLAEKLDGVMNIVVNPFHKSQLMWG